MKTEEDESPYCETCGGCGYVGCDGVRRFLELHVKGKTNCDHEAAFIEEIISEVERDED
jgi:hypothetical protein